jgi:purine nucleoside phosphorylase
VATGIIFGSHTGIFARKHLKRKMKKGHGTPKFDSKSKSSHFKKLELFFLEKSKSHTYQLYDFNKRTSLYFLYLICLIGLLR